MKTFFALPLLALLAACASNGTATSSAPTQSAVPGGQRYSVSFPVAGDACAVGSKTVTMTVIDTKVYAEDERGTHMTGDLNGTEFKATGGLLMGGVTNTLTGHIVDGKLTDLSINITKSSGLVGTCGGAWHAMVATK